MFPLWSERQLGKKTRKPTGVSEKPHNKKVGQKNVLYVFLSNFFAYLFAYMVVVGLSGGAREF